MRELHLAQDTRSGAAAAAAVALLPGYDCVADLLALLWCVIGLCPCLTAPRRFLPFDWPEAPANLPMPQVAALRGGHAHPNRHHRHGSTRQHRSHHRSTPTSGMFDVLTRCWNSQWKSPSTVAFRAERRRLPMPTSSATGCCLSHLLSLGRPVRFAPCPPLLLHHALHSTQTRQRRGGRPTATTPSSALIARCRAAGRSQAAPTGRWPPPPSAAAAHRHHVGPWLGWDEPEHPWGDAAISARAQGKLDEAKTLIDNYVALVRAGQCARSPCSPTLRSSAHQLPPASPLPMCRRMSPPARWAW